MKSGELEELERQGAKAAARGEPPHANPLLDPSNAPTATGEPPHVWRARLLAWQSGFDAQSRGVDAPTRH